MVVAAELNPSVNRLVSQVPGSSTAETQARQIQNPYKVHVAAMALTAYSKAPARAGHA